ncbi:MAG: M17 family peptidase N-terminal domain-containing protein [Desulfuromonadales bacterium]|nr:M17 family peptidase N-terminal domain-containing protein [Desulfuromonadales bacterium]
MKPLQRTTLSADCLPGDSVVALYFADQKPLEGPAALLDWRLDGQLTRMLLDGDVSGRAGEHVVLQNNGKLQANWVLFVGGGMWHGLCRETHAALVRHMLNVARQAGFKDISLVFIPHAEVCPDVLQQQIENALVVEGAGLEVCRFACEPVVSI